MDGTDPAHRGRAALKLMGEQIRETRKFRRMTLEDLADASGLSVTFISRLERGHVACSIGNLLGIAGALDLPPASLFAAPEAAAPPAAFRIARAGDGPNGATDGSGPYAWRRLASGRAEQRLEAFLLELPRGARNAPLVTHPGEEFCYVLQGRVEFRVGEDIVTLAAGDSIHLRSDVPHMAWSAGRTSAQLLLVTAIDNRPATTVEWWAQYRSKPAPAARHGRFSTSVAKKES